VNSLVCRHDCNKDGHQPLTENALNAALEGQTENSDNARGNNPGVLPHPLEDFSHYSDSVTGARTHSPSVSRPYDPGGLAITAVTSPSTLVTR